MASLWDSDTPSCCRELTYILFQKQPIGLTAGVPTMPERWWVLSFQIRKAPSVESLRLTSCVALILYPRTTFLLYLGFELL